MRALQSDARLGALTLPSIEVRGNACALEVHTDNQEHFLIQACNRHRRLLAILRRGMNADHFGRRSTAL